MARNRRQRQLMHNLDYIFGGYANGMSDYGTTEYPPLSVEEAYDLAIPEIYHMQSDGSGWTTFRTDICKDLRFLGNDYIKDCILDVAAECGVLKDEL